MDKEKNDLLRDINTFMPENAKPEQVEAIRVFLRDKPRVIFNLVKNFSPFVQWQMTKDAPYGISAPGTKVSIIAYNESGTVSVVVTPENRTEAGTEHLRKLCENNGKDFEEAKINAYQVTVETKYLERVPDAGAPTN